VSSGFQPALDRKGGHRVIRKPYPKGVAGVSLSLMTIAQFIREGQISEKVQGWAMDQLRAAGIDGRRGHNNFAKASALLAAVREATVYTADHPRTEHLKSAEAMLCLREGLCIRGGDCFPEGTLLLRSDHELVPIEDIKAGDQIWGLGKWSTVTGVKFKGELSVDALVLNNGSVVHLTADHKVYVGRCKHGKGTECTTCARPSLRQESFTRIHVSDLQEDDVLLQPERIAFGAGDVDQGRAYVEGLALSDGWVDEYRFKIAGRDGMRKEAQKHEVKAICEKLGVETHWHKRYITVKDPDWAQRIASLGHYAREKHLETIALNEPTAEAYLRGVADSTANTYGKGRTYSTTSRRLFLQVRVLHRMFGRSCSVHFMTPEKHGGAGKHPMWRLGVRDSQASKGEKVLAVRSIERAVRKATCWDISTDDQYVYLPEHDVTVSNCDDVVVLLGSVCGSVGIPVRVIKQTFDPIPGDPNPQEHVLLEGQNDDGTWFPMDPSTHRPCGQKEYAAEEYRVDPNKPHTIGLKGAPDGELIGVGKHAPNGVAGKPSCGGPGHCDCAPCQAGATAATMGLGAPPTGAAIPSTVVVSGTYALASQDLDNQMRLPMVAADGYYNNGDFPGAVTSYQAAGSAGVSQDGPEIDLAGAAIASSPFTSLASQANAMLQSISATGAGQAEADSARSLALLMLTYYQQAMAAGQASLDAASKTGGVPRGATAQVSLLQAVGVAAAAGAAVGLLYSWWKGQQRGGGRRAAYAR